MYVTLRVHSARAHMTCTGARLVMIWACVQGSIQVMGTVVKKFSQLRKLIKAQCYKKRKLLPRSSDADFPDGLGEIVGPDAPDRPEDKMAGMTLADADDFLDKGLGNAEDFFATLRFLDANPVSIPVDCHMGCAVAWNSVMMKVVSTLSPTVDCQQAPSVTKLVLG